MAKDPNDRPRSAVELRHHLERLHGSVVVNAADDTTDDDTTDDDTTDDDTATADTTTADAPTVLPNATAVADVGSTRRFSRRNRSLAVGAVAIAVFISLLSLASMNRSSASSSAANPGSDTPTVSSNEDAFYGAPATPRNIVATLENNLLTISWDPVDGAARYEVENPDSDRPAAVTKTNTVSLEIHSGERPCGVIRSVSAAGLLSVDSAIICAT
ncbi:MAG: hypothetical protein R2706_02955 [Acidimicrobiales bacterium]